MEILIPLGPIWEIGEERRTWEKREGESGRN